MLQDDCAFQKADGSALISFSEMNADTAVNIVPCPHDSFRDAENMICDFCDQAMNVSVSNAAGTKYYVGLAAACAGLANGDTIKLLNDIDVKDGVKGPEIKANDVTFDFNGKKFDGIYGVISIYTKVTIIDTAGGGYGFFSVTTDRAGNVSDVVIDASADTKKRNSQTSKDALDKATEELTAKIAEKASASEVDTAIKDLTAAIANAQSVNNAYVDEKNGALKTELEGKIAKAQEEVTAAISALSARLEAVENKTNTLQTVLIVFIVVLSLANVASVATFVIRKRR